MRYILIQGNTDKITEDINVNIDWSDNLQWHHYFELCLQENIRVLRKNLKEDKI